MTSVPVAEANRIQSLDVLRGFALLGILLLNIIGFGLHSSSYNNPGFDLANVGGIDVFTYATIELFAEGAMRCLFSILFGAGVVLFLTGRSGTLHYKRTFWLLMFGLFDAYVLLWNGDILVTYAICGAVLYLLRDSSFKALMSWSITIIVLMSLMYWGMGYGLSTLEQAARQVAENPEQVDEQTREMAQGWQEFVADYQPSGEKVKEEMDARKGSYLSAFSWNAAYTTEFLLFVVPMILLWDAMAMMILGMAFYKAGILQGEKSNRFYFNMMAGGFSVGLLVNSYEVYTVISNNFALLESFPSMRPTYHIGRLGMAVGYVGLIVWLTKTTFFVALKSRLAAVGRMALTNYLMHSFICLFIFTGAGLALVGDLSRAMLYPIVLGIWIFQLWFSPWWLERYKFGPLEWLWRGLTYGERPPLART